MRYIFTDKWNSFWHAFFGFISFYFPIIIPIFLLYQFSEGGKNLPIDITEFVIGFFLSFLYSVLCKKRALTLLTTRI